MSEKTVKVRGYWRTYRNGKRIRIKMFMRRPCKPNRQRPSLNDYAQMYGGTVELLDGDARRPAGDDLYCLVLDPRGTLPTARKI